MALNANEILIGIGIDLGQLKEQSAAAGFVLENSTKKTLKSLKKLTSINMISIAKDVLDIWDDMTKKMAESFYGIGKQNRQGEQLDANRMRLRKLREEFEKEDAEKEARLAKEAAYNRENDLLQLQIKHLKEIQDLKAKGWTDEDTKMLETRKRHLQEENDIIRKQRARFDPMADPVAWGKATAEMTENQTKITEIDQAIAGKLTQSQINDAVKSARKKRLGELQKDLADKRSELGNEMARSEFGRLAEIAASDKGHWDRQVGRSGWGAGRRWRRSQEAVDAENRMAALAQRYKFLTDPLWKMKEEAEASRKALEDFQKNGMQLKAAP